ncbi:MAG: YaeQ family protein [Deltaproteobacteria bacterium]|nr:YaeQ family protein [Deltaproteobacteria bacterium]
MAIKATICKANIQIADMDRGYYEDLSLTIAQHPSETDERMMVRLLAFALHAAEGLRFTEGISAEEDEPDIWLKNLTGEIEIWIDVGLPDEKRIKKACNRARQVYIYPYGGRVVPAWWQPMAEKLSKHKNLKVIALPQAATKSLAELAQRTMTIQCTVNDGQIWIGDDKKNVLVEPETLYG